MIQTCHPEDERAYLIGVMQSLEATGDMAEIGVYQGGIAKIIKEQAPHNTKIHLFDTFTGILQKHEEPSWKDGDYRCPLPEVKRLIGEEFIFHKGDIVEMKHEVSENEFSFIHVDIDVFLPLNDLLPFFYDRLVKGGAMLISNYDDSHPGVLKAVNSFIKGKVVKKYSRYIYLKK